MFLPYREIPFTYSVSALLLVAGFTGMINKGFYNKLRFHPFAVFKGKRIHTLFTSAFIHNNLSHLFFNVFVFYLMSYDLEYVMLDQYAKWYSQIFLIIFFIITTVLVNLINGWRHRNNVTWSSAGASGSIMAFVTFTTAYLPLDHASSRSAYFPIYYAYQFCLVFLIGSFAFTFKKSRYDHFAHFYGAILGVILAIIIRPKLIADLFNHFCDG